MSDVVNLIDEMEGYFEECKTVPFSSSKLIVDEVALYEFLTDLRLKLPEEIKRAQRILDEKERIILDAREEAKEAESKAAARVESLVNEHKISQQAEVRAEEIIGEAKALAKEIKISAYDYVEDLVEQIETAMHDTIEQANNHYSKFEDYMIEQIKVMESNRNELKSGRTKTRELS